MHVDRNSRYGSAIDRSIVAGRQTVVVLRNRPPASPLRTANPPGQAARPPDTVAAQTDLSRPTCNRRSHEHGANYHSEYLHRYKRV